MSRVVDMPKAQISNTKQYASLIRRARLSTMRGVQEYGMGAIVHLEEMF